MENLIRRILKEEIVDKKVICDNCGWSWNLSEGGKDPLTCHKCGFKNPQKKKSNLEIVFDLLSQGFPQEHKNKLDNVRNFVENYITKNNFNVKFSKYCNTGFSGVRTNNEIIICNPSSMGKLGDFLYTIFHEIRHESQISNIKMDNPLSDYDLEDFEKIYEQYWEMELDADQFAKNMIAKFVKNFNIPISIAQKYFGLSLYIKSYPSMSQYIRNNLKLIIDTIIDLKKQGIEVNDARDIPSVKPHLDHLEDLL